MEKLLGACVVFFFFFPCLSGKSCPRKVEMTVKALWEKKALRHLPLNLIRSICFAHKVILFYIVKETVHLS